MGQKRLSIQEVDDLIEKREKGWSYERLAERFAVTPGAVHYQCLKNGAVSPNQRRGISPINPVSFVAGDGRTQRRFTQSEDKQLLDLEASGIGYNEIARRMGRARTSVRMRLLTLALREDLPA